MIAIRLTRQERDALVWDDLRCRGVPSPVQVVSGRRWSTFEATAADWQRLAAYADGQAEHWSHDIGCDRDENAAIRRDSERCRRVAERIRAAMKGAAR